MDLIKKISNYIVNRYGENVLLFIDSDKDLAEIIDTAYFYVSGGGPSLITNKSAFQSGYYQDMKPDLKKLQEQIKAEIYSQMYSKNLITESEYKKVCHTQ